MNETNDIIQLIHHCHRKVKEEGEDSRMNLGSKFTREWTMHDTVWRQITNGKLLFRYYVADVVDFSSLVP
jgi:hypothetical protein